MKHGIELRLDGKNVTPNTNSKNLWKISFDGKKATSLKIDTVLLSKQDCEGLIEFLQIHQHCFNE